MADELNEFLTETTTDVSGTALPDEEAPYRCVKCGRALEYAGVGRRPTLCKKGEGCKAEAPTTRARTNEIDRIRSGMLELYVTVAAGVSFIDQYDGMQIGANANKLADSWANLAQQDPKVRKVLIRMLNGTSWSGVLAAHVMVAIPIMQHHNIAPTFAKEAVDQ